MNSIWPSAVTVSTSSRANRPFSPTSMKTPSSGLPSSRQARASGPKARATGIGSGQSTSGIGLPFRRTGPKRISRQAMVAVGLISIVAGGPRGRPPRENNKQGAPPPAGLIRHGGGGGPPHGGEGGLEPPPPPPPP